MNFQGAAYRLCGEGLPITCSEAAALFLDFHRRGSRTSRLSVLTKALS